MKNEINELNPFAYQDAPGGHNHGGPGHERPEPGKPGIPHPDRPPEHNFPHPERPPEHERNIVIFVNGRPVEWNKRTISFEEAITIAFGKYDPAPHIAYTVSYFDGPNNAREGTLTKGHSIPVKDGEKINADRTDRS